MRLVIQRVKSAKLSVENQLISEIGQGLVVFVGIEKGEDLRNLDIFAKKIANLRIMSDDNGKMNLSVKDVGGEMLIVSQFTLFGDTNHGNRPSFFGAEEPYRANELYLEFVEKVKNYGISVKTGVFGADMQIIQQNDGPVTIIM